MAISIGADGQEAHRNRARLVRYPVKSAIGNLMDRGVVPNGLPRSLQPAARKAFTNFNVYDRHHAFYQDKLITTRQQPPKPGGSPFDDPNYNPGDRRGK